MKLSHIFYILGILLCLSSCSKGGYEPYIPSEWEYDRYSDAGISPGDDFYHFVCGKGIASEGSDSWAPHPRWIKQESDFLNLAFSDGGDNTVPVMKRLNELKSAALSEELLASAFAAMRDRLNGIRERTENWEFPETAAEYCREGYSLFLVSPTILDGRRFGFSVTAVYAGLLQDWTGQQLEQAGIKDEYNALLPKARLFEKYLMDNIKDDGESIGTLDAGNPAECRLLKEYVESFAATKAGSGAIGRFASALGNRNPDFVPSGSATRQYFELAEKMEGTEMKEAAAAFLWCAAVAFDMDFKLNARTQTKFIQTALYPNLQTNMSHKFCDENVDPECGARNRAIFEALRSTMGERIERSEWMTPYTKACAREKLDAMECHTGILDWSRYEAEMPVSGDFCSALHEVGVSNISKLMAISGENGNLDHLIAISSMTPFLAATAYAANSFYIKNANAMCILPSSTLLMDMNPEFPFMTYVIAHELCHGFDSDGASYNALGQFGDWWSINDRLVFKKKQEQLIGIFNQYYVGGTTFCNGARTTAEDMADLGGLEIAYYTTARELEKKYSGEELLEMERRFFKSYAVFYAQHFSLEEKIKHAAEDEHSINEYRINGIVNHIDDWYRLFDVTPERKLYLSPDRRVSLW
ncbi:MAG: hypothetical protein MJY57_03845 [Bacteroidales bacterium]|nr:hypothetical protein [Bacteroidales bacterium]